MKRTTIFLAMFSILLLLTACGRKTMDGKWNVTIKTPFFEGRVLSIVLTLEKGLIFDSNGSRIGSYEMETDNIQSLDFDFRAGGISGVSLQAGSFEDNGDISGTTVVLKRNAFGDTLKGEWWKAKRLDM